MNQNETPIPELAIREASSLTSSWYLNPDFYLQGIYNDIYLGECVEYSFYQDILRVIQFQLENSPSAFQKLSSQTVITRPSLDQFRFPLNSEYKIQQSLKNTASRARVLISVRPQNLAVVHALSSSNMFELIIEGNQANLSDELTRLKINYEPLDAYFTPEILAKGTEIYQKMLPRWKKSIESKPFQRQFQFAGLDFIESAVDCLNQIIQKQFLEIIQYIEVLKSLYASKKIDLAILWNDSLPQHRASALLCRQLHIPSLHIAHGVYHINPTNRIIYTDKIAVFGEYSKRAYMAEGNLPEKIVVTGNPEWDKYYWLTNTINKESVCHHFNLNPEITTILFASFASESHSMTEHYYRHLLKAVIALNKKKTLQLVIKLHPVEWFREPWYRKLSLEEGLDDIIITKEFIAELLTISDIIICRGSSNIKFEAYFYEKIAVISDSPSIFGTDMDQIIVSDPTQFYNVLENIIFKNNNIATSKKERAAALLKYNYQNDGRALFRVIELISELTGKDIVLPAAYKNGFLSRLLSVKREKLETPDDDVKRLLIQGDAAYAKSNIKKALSLFYEAFEKKPHSSEVLIRLGRSFLQTMKFNDALKYLKMLLDIQADYTEAILLCALAEFYQHRFESSLSYLKKIISGQSFDSETYSRAYYYAGRCYKELGIPEKVDRYCEKAILADPNFKDPYKFLGEWFFRNGLTDKAENIYFRLLDRDPFDREIYYYLGNIFFQKKKFDKSIPYLKKALEIDPCYFDALNTLVEINRSQNNYAEAILLIDDFLAADQENKKVMLLRKKLTIESKKYS